LKARPLARRRRRGRNFDAEFEADIRLFFRDFYHLELTDAQLRTLLVSS